MSRLECLVHGIFLLPKHLPSSHTRATAERPTHPTRRNETGSEKKKRASLVTGCEKNTFHIPRATFFKRLVHTVAFILLRRRYLTVIRRCDCVAFSNVQSPIERHRADTKISPKVSLQEGGHLFPWCYVHSVRKTLGN